MPEQIKPYGGTSRQRLTDLINSANGLSLIEGIDFEYGPIVPYSDQPGANTKVTLKSHKAGSNDTDIHYARLGIDVLGHLPVEFLKDIWIDSVPFNIHDILDRINEALGLNLVSEEVVNLRFESLQETYPLRITPGKSYAWRESEYLFKASQTQDLSDVYLITNLDGLYPPN